MAEISAPNQAAYSVWGPAYAQALAAKTGSSVAGPLNMLALQSFMAQENGGYGEALAGTQQAQLQAARMDAEVERMKAAYGIIPSLVANGATAYGQQMLQQGGLLPNAAAGQALDTLNAQDVMAGAFKNRAAGMAAVAEAGYAPLVANINDVLMPPTPTAPLPEFVPHMTPANTNDKITADARTVAAQADLVAANRPRSSGGGGGGGSTTFTVVPPMYPGGQPTISVRTKDPSVAEQYMSGGGLPSGNSVEQAGGAKSAAQRLADLLNIESK